MSLLPVALNVQKLNCLVVGGGAVAARKSRVLLECEARVHVVSLRLSEEFEDMREHVEFAQRDFEVSDVEGVDLIFACTSDAEVNSEIAREARARKIWCNIADDADASTLHSAAVVRRGEIAIGISTGGGSPALARHLKQQIENCIGDEYEQLLKLMSERRSALKESAASQPERARLWREVLASEVLNLLRAGEATQANEVLDDLLNPHADR